MIATYHFLQNWLKESLPKLSASRRFKRWGKNKPMVMTGSLENELSLPPAGKSESSMKEEAGKDEEEG